MRRWVKTRGRPQLQPRAEGRPWAQVLLREVLPRMGETGGQRCPSGPERCPVA